MNILENNELSSFRKSVRGFVEKELQPNAIKWENSRNNPNQIIRKVAKKKWLGLSLSTKDGGHGKSFWHEVILAEELARSKAMGTSLAILVQTGMASPLISELGTPLQKSKILKPALGGKYIFALAATDPSTGSDLVSQGTVATKSGKGFELVGEKKYITNGSIADYLIVLARTGESNALGHSLFLISSKNSDIKRSRLKTSGFKSGDTGWIKFNNVQVTSDSMLGKPGMGFIHLLKGLQKERLIGAIALNSLALYAWEETLKSLNSKIRFGKPLTDKQVIKHKLVELRTKIEASRQFAYSVCAKLVEGEPIDKDVLMLKMFCYETVQESIEQSLHLMGAEGFLRDHWLSHARDDAQAFTLAAGSSEIIRDLLSAHLIKTGKTR